MSQIEWDGSYSVGNPEIDEHVSACTVTSKRRFISYNHAVLELIECAHNDQDETGGHLSAMVAVIKWLLLAGCLVIPPAGLAASAHRVDAAALKEHVRVLSVTHVPRDSRHPHNLLKAAQYIRQKFASYSRRTRFQTYQVGGSRYHNVIAEFGPATGPRIVVGAHYDAAIGTPGADDNASGVAVLIELAALLARQSPGMKVELVAYSLEEPPYFRTASMGSYRHAAYLKKQQAEVKVMLSLEMLGFYRAQRGSQRYPLGFLRYLYSDTGDFIAVIGKLSQLGIVRKVRKHLAANTRVKVRSIAAPPGLTGVDFSDHLNYWKFGYRAVMITDTAFYRNPHYHRATDTWNRLDYKTMAALTSGLHRLVMRLARPD